MLAGSMVVMALLFFAMFSSPSSNRRTSSAHPNMPNLGRGPGSRKTADDGHSVTPLLNADTRNPNDEPGGVTPEDVHNTARRNALANASPSFGPPVATPAPSTPRPAPKDYALNRIDFPTEPQPAAPAAVAPLRSRKSSTRRRWYLCACPRGLVSPRYRSFRRNLRCLNGIPSSMPCPPAPVSSLGLKRPSARRSKLRSSLRLNTTTSGTAKS